MKIARKSKILGKVLQNLTAQGALYVQASCTCDYIRQEKQGMSVISEGSGEVVDMSF